MTEKADAVLPLAEEHMVVETREVTTGGLRVHLRTETVEREARSTLRSTTVEIERIPIGRQVASPPLTREEDGVTIIPVIEEVLVVEKRLMLKEEIRIRHVSAEHEAAQTISLRRQLAEIERLSAGDILDTATPGGA